MNAPATPAPESRTTLHHRRHAKTQRAKSLGHLVPAVALLLAVLPVLSGQEPFTRLVALGFLVGAAYLVLMVRELRHLRHTPFHREPVAWLELAAAGILAFESYHIWHRHHLADLASGVPNVHFLPWLYAAMALAFVVMAFRMNQLAGRRFLHLHADGVAARTHPLGRAQELRWAAAAAVEPAAAADLLIRRHDGQTRRLSFADVHDGAAHRDRVLAHYQSAMSNEQ